ncbi:hypothetical protein BVY01_04910 [bacterium I07]|nr:hypothetical protein BVY01_04910 [bacterium I07]
MQTCRDIDMTALLKGIIPAVFTPMMPDGRIDSDRAENVVVHLLSDGIDGIYVCGTTGEGISLTAEERMDIAAAYVNAAERNIPVVIQVGHNSLAVARHLAEHSQQIGADAISAIPPFYYSVDADAIIKCLKDIASAAPGLPLYYYHIPQLNRVDLEIPSFIEKAVSQIPNFRGLKFAKWDIPELQISLNECPAGIEIVFGCDEMFLSGLAAGAVGAIGSTFNFAAPLYRKIAAAFHANDMIEARDLQLKALQMIRLLYRFGGQPAFKSAMDFINCGCGPNRLPLISLNTREKKQLEMDLDKIGFFDWGRG